VSDRAVLRQDFVAHCGFQTATVTPLAADASFRSYHRVQHNGQSMVLMDAPPPQEDIRPFCAIAQRLLDMQFSAPSMLAKDPEQGFLLLEDFGDTTFSRLLNAGENEAELYDLAINVLIALHRESQAATGVSGHKLPEYDEALYLKEARLLPEWFLPAVGITVTPELMSAFDAAWRSVLPVLEPTPKTLVLRDFHVDNLMRLDDRDGIAACGLLDFQDAVYGPVVYDIMSLLEDARRDISESVVAGAKEKYLQAFPDLDPQQFSAAWAVLAAQRHAKVIGIFTRLQARDNKPHYLGHIPRIWRLLEAALAHPCMEPVAAWFDAYVPRTARVRP
jgi:aminoglycoside/choline kinase family phosphotransferase